MARKVYRYGPLEVIDEEPQQVLMPVDSKVVHVGSKRDGYIDIWAIVDEDSEVSRVRTFQVFRSGVPIPEDAQYIDSSVQSSAIQNGNRVWHVFERLAD